jgi:probable F420-dependent oxidoreductase
MTRVRFGVVASGQETGELPEAADVRELAKWSEDCGFDSLWTSDHISFANPILEGMVSLSFLAGCTHTITLGTGIYLLPLRHPSAVAKQVASIAHLAPGRVIFGIGVGGESRQDFAAVQVPHEERGERTDEALALIDSLLAGPSASFQGRFYAVSDVTISPRPARPVPVWVGGRSEAALRRAAYRGQGWLGWLESPGGFARRRDRLQTLAHEAGRDPDAVEVAIMLPTLPASDDSQALQRLTTHLSARYARRFEPERVQGVGLAGSASALVDRIGDYVDAGAQHVIFNLATAPNQRVDNLQLLADDVMPQLR